MKTKGSNQGGALKDTVPIGGNMLLPRTVKAGQAS